MKPALVASSFVAMSLAALVVLGLSTGPRPLAPGPREVTAAFRPSDARLTDRRGETIHELRVDRTRRRLAWTPLSAVSPALIDAVIASEDRRFFDHAGVDWAAVAAAAWRRAGGGPRRGASTITMQLAALLDPELRRDGAPRNLERKWAQMRAAWAMESRWTKEEILEAYLNLVTFRGELQGAAAAAAVLFDKTTHGLTRDEALVLAALLRAPNADRRAVERRVARAAADCRAGPPAWRCEAPPISPALAAALARALDRPRGTGPRIKLAPHVARQFLRPDSPVAVRSTLEASLQRFATESLRRHLLALRGRHVSDGAVLVADNESGEVLAYVGSSGSLSPAPEVDGVRARRQAGSSLKPFLYAALLDERLLTAASRLEDSPLEIPVGGALYRPQNYDDAFRGLVSVRQALAGSLNVPAVRALRLLGVDAFARVLRRLGFSLDRSGDDYGPSLALGSADVSLWELVSAYRSLAAGGAISSLALTPDPGPPDPGLRVFSPEAAFLTADILADRESRATTFGLESPLSTRFWTAVKTGTSKDMRDNWCLGFSRRYTVGVWVGNFSGMPMHDVSGVSGAAPVWLEVMERLHAAAPSTAPEPPSGLVRLGAEWFVAGTEPARVPQLADVPRILSPAAGTVVAVDPDIPAERQRVAFAARASAATWRLDGDDAGSGDVLWTPRSGQHRLELVDARGRVVDTVAFAVKSPPPLARASELCQSPFSQRSNHGCTQDRR